MSATTGQIAAQLNPLWQKSARSRLRMRHLLSWGLVTVAITAFVFLITYMTMTERELATPEVAAKTTLPALIIIQAIVLMMFGTGAVAMGVAQERDEGLLDYQRMTPMSPRTKILGYLFGLPVREYLLFALTLPFVMAAAWISNFSLLTLAHFYVVFFTSVWVYHMTGLVAGMIAPNARLAAFISMALVALLYFALPNLSRIGITFFEFLTIRPTLFGLIYQELPADMRPRAEASGIDTFRDVPFFAWMLHPTVYSLLVQGFLLATMYMIAHRKWRDQTRHLLSKSGALLVYLGVIFFLLASVCALVGREDAYWSVFRRFEREFGPPQEILMLLLFLSMLIMGVAYVLIISVVTPSRFTAVAGLRRARKLGHARVGLNADAASSLPLALLLLAISIGAGASIMALAIGSGRYFDHGPDLYAIGVLIVGVLGAGLFVQGLREWTSLRVYGIGLFLLWMLPFFAMMILIAAFEEFVPGTYIGLPCPPVSLGFALMQMLETTSAVAGVDPRYMPDEIAADAVAITTTGAAGYAIAAITVQLARAARWRHRRKAM